MIEDRKRCSVGIDFGGTFVKLALVDDRGDIRGRSNFATTHLNGVTEWLDEVERHVNALLLEMPEGLEWTGVGVGVPGFVDYAHGFVHGLTNVPGWADVPLSELLQRRFGKPAKVDNDVNAMAVGECMFGAGRAYRNAVFVTLGTGVGGGILINDNLYRGAYSMAGEIGHISIDRNGIQSPMGRGGVEQYIGNRQIVAYALKQIDGGVASSILELAKGDRSQVSPKIIAEAAAQGDELAIQVFDYVADCLATMLASVTYLLQPQAFIIGGGVANAGAVLFEPLRNHVRERLHPQFADRLEIRNATLGNDAGVIGSATLLFLD